MMLFPFGEQKFKSQGRERVSWANHDLSDDLDRTKAQRARLPGLKPSTRTISLRLPEPLIARLGSGSI
jgi:hypothetical protein